MSEMKNIKRNMHFWIFGPEYGCLTREILIIEKYLKTNNYEITLYIHKNHNEFVKNIFKDKVKIINYGFSIKLVYKNNLDINIIQTYFNLLMFVLIGSVRQFLMFRKSLKENPIVITDFLPQIIIFAKILRKPIIGIYNYSLDYISLGKNPFAEVLSFFMAKIYKLTYNFCSISFIEQIAKKDNYKNRVFVSPIARNILIDNEKIREELNVRSDEKLIFLSIGGNSNPTEIMTKFHKIIEKTKYKILILPRDDFELKQFKEKYKLFVYPKKTVYDTQNYMCSCDLVISKAGFGTIGECLNNNCKILPIHLERHAEIRETEINLKKNNLIIDSIYTTDTGQEIVNKIEKTLNNQIILNNIKDIKCSGENEVFEKLNDWLLSNK